MNPEFVEYTDEQVIDALTYTINHGERYWKALAIPKIEDKYKAKFVGEFSINQGAGWTEFPVALFYQETPPEGYDQYFGIYIKNENMGVYIVSGQSAADTEILGVVSRDNEIIYSRFRHDYRISTDGTVMIDGGRDYLKTSGGPIMRLQIIKDKLVIMGPVDNDAIL